MKATKELISSIPADALVTYDNRADHSKSFSTTWVKQCEVDGFAEQFIGAQVEKSAGEGCSEFELSGIPEDTAFYTMYIEEGEHTDKQGTCAKERMSVFWSSAEA